MMCLRSWFASSPSGSNFLTTNKIQILRWVSATTLFLLAIACQAQPGQTNPSTDPPQTKTSAGTVTIPAGTQLALVLTHPVESRYIHHGDPIYAQITSPVNDGDAMVIAPGTFVQGTVDKLEQRRGQRAELRLQAMSITFPDGYVASVAGPIRLESNQGYAVNDPGSGRVVAAFALPAAGAGLGALIGHSVGAASSTTTSTLPPGCIAGPPFCITTTTPVFGTKGKDAVIGAGIGGAIGAVASVALLFSSHRFFLDVGSPVEMTLQQPLILQRKEVDAAIQQSEQNPVAEQPIMPRPEPPPPPDFPVDHGTCYTPGTPGTPPTVIPGAPGPDGVPGPPTIIPGIPPSPGTPYPCP